MLATVMEVLDTSVANVALPHIAGNLSATPEEATWVLTSYLISNAIILPATSWIGKYIGRKRFLIICIIIFTVASALCGAAPNLTILIIARILQGMGGGALQPIAQSVLLESFPPAKRGAAMAITEWASSSLRSSARRWAAGSRTIIRGVGSFTSICRSDPRRFHGEHLRRGSAVSEGPEAGPDRLHRIWFDGSGVRRARADARSGPAAGLVRIVADRLRRATFSVLSILIVCRVGALHARADRQSSRVSKPKFRRRVRDDRFGRRRALWLDGAVAAVFADAFGLSRGRERFCGQSARRRVDRFDDGRRAADRQRSTRVI